MVLQRKIQFTFSFQNELKSIANKLYRLYKPVSFQKPAARKHLKLQVQCQNATIPLWLTNCNVWCGCEEEGPEAR